MVKNRGMIHSDFLAEFSVTQIRPVTYLSVSDPDNAGAGSTDYMHLFSVVALGFMWVQIAKVAVEKLDAGAGDDKDYLENKLITARFYMERIMPETVLRRQRVEVGAGSMMALDAAAF